MKKRMSTSTAIAVYTPFMVLLLAVMICLIVFPAIFWRTISMFLYGRAQTTDATVLTAGTDLCEDIVEEGVVLLKNQKDEDGKPALPLSESEIAKINVFGWAAYDWMTMAFGSGYSNTSVPKVKLFPALAEAGIEYNTTLYNMYKNYYSAKSNVYNKKEDEQEYRGGVEFASEEIFVLREPGAGYYTDAIIKNASEFSNVALVVIGRTGSEAKDLQPQQIKQTQQSGRNEKITVTDRHYLELSVEEEQMIAAAKRACGKVIVLLNTANTMEAGFIEDDEIDAALLVGITGLTGVNGLINVLRGEKIEQLVERDEDGNVIYDKSGAAVYKKDEDGNILTEKVKVSPSGRTADTYAYDIFTAPTSVNSTNTGAQRYTNIASNEKSYYSSYIDYYEGIYVGYKWYETADAEGFFNDVSNEYGTGYDGVVQFPFGYGMTYSEFKWNVTHVYINGKEQRYGSATQLGKNDKIEIYVEVHNVGDFPAMDVVELFYTVPYIKGGIEKAYVALGDFAKTGVIQPDESDIVKLEITAQSMASYDCYDANGNKHTGYELDGGDYYIRLMKNAHEEGAMTENSKTSSSIHYTVPEGGYNYDVDEKTQNAVENRFTNKSGKGNDEVIDNGDLDGSHESTPVTYLSRNNFKATYPKKITDRTRTADATTVAKAKSPTKEQLEKTGYADVTAPKVVNSYLTINDVLDAERYDEEIWDYLVAQIPASELINLVQDGYFQTAALPSIGKVAYIDLDGPLGFNTRVTSDEGVLCEFVAYPSATVLAQTWNVNMAYAMGLSVGDEAASMQGLRGWYAPGANIHRNPFCGRNGEYYSEDAVLSGKICAGTVKGAKDKGVYSYVKHFVVNDSETNREGLFTFLTEQTLREIYLKPFEIMIKEGGGNALMTSMNRLGRVWSGANYGLCTEILRNEWGFNGTLVTDWVNAADEYMPPYKGIWAGNDIWLSNGIGNEFNILNNNATATVLAKKVAHDVLWTIVDTERAAKTYDPNAARPDLSAGAEYNLTWVWYIVLVELPFAAGIAVMAVFLALNIIENKKAAKSAASEPAAEPEPIGEPEPTGDQS